MLNKYDDVTLVSVVFNEAERVQGFIDKHKNLFKTIIFVDQSSTDDTAKIIKANGYEVIRDVCRGFPEPSRHLAVCKANTPWIIVLDADEYLNPEFINKLDSYINSEYDGFILGANHMVDGKSHGIHVNNYRFFKRGASFMHHVYHGGIVPIHGIKTTKLEYACYNHDKSSAEAEVDINRYLEIEKNHPELVHTPWFQYYQIVNNDLSNTITVLVDVSTIERAEACLATINNGLDLHNATKIACFNRKASDEEVNWARKIGAIISEGRANTLEWASRLIGTPYFIRITDDHLLLNSFNLKSITASLVRNPKVKALNLHDDSKYKLEDPSVPFLCFKTNHLNERCFLTSLDYYKKLMKPIMKVRPFNEQLDGMPHFDVMQHKYGVYSIRHENRYFRIQ